MAALQPHPKAPATWLQARPYRACELCDYGQLHLPAQLHCYHPDAATSGAAVPVCQVRALGGVCGPEAELMHVEWMRP